MPSVLAQQLTTSNNNTFASESIIIRLNCNYVVVSGGPMTIAHIEKVNTVRIKMITQEKKFITCKNMKHICKHTVGKLSVKFQLSLNSRTGYMDKPLSNF